MVAKVGDKELVGQRRAIEHINHWRNKDSFPHFLLVAGDVGSGRKTISYLFAQALDARVSTVPDISVASIRKLIDVAYQIDSKMVYLIPNADTMSIAAKNSLLKLTEEPPANAYIIMTLETLDNTLPTLRSRSQHIVMEPYTAEELSLISEDKLFSQIATTPGMVETLQSMGIQSVNELLSTCDKLIQYIDKVTVANALKSAQKIKFKDSDRSDVDLELFLAAMSYSLSLYMQNAEMLSRISSWYRVIAKYRPMFKRSGVNKRAVYDKLIFSIRDALYVGGVKNGLV